MRNLISRHLEHYLALYDARNMHLAAERRGVSQPALTRSLKLLEADVGAELFVRTPRGLEPTEAGEALHRHARAMEQAARLATLEVRTARDVLTGELRIGVGPILTASVFPPVAAAFHTEFPGVNLVVETGISSVLVEELAKDRLDVVFASLPQTPLPDRFASAHLFSTGMAVTCRAGHPLLTRPAPELAALGAWRRVGFIEDFEFDRCALRLFGRGSAVVPPIVQTQSLNVMFGILAVTDHYAIVSELILDRARAEGLCRLPLAEPLWSLDVGLICRTSVMNARPIRALRDALASAAALRSRADAPVDGRDPGPVTPGSPAGTRQRAAP